MLILTKHPERDYEKGQYHIQLVDMPIPFDIKTQNRFGYFCDKAHLKHMIRDLLKEFSEEEIREIMNWK